MYIKASRPREGLLRNSANSLRRCVVTQKSIERCKMQSPLDRADAALAAEANFEEFTDLQVQWSDLFEEANQQWLNLMQAEVDLVSEFASNLTVATSIPHVMTACQQWGKQHLELMVEDAKCTMDIMKKIMQTSAQVVAKAQEKNP